MNAVDASVKKNQNVPLSVFLKSLYYTLPFGMFMIACNCLFESVRDYYFDWMIVMLPTIAVCAIANLYEMFTVHQESGFFMKRENSFSTKRAGYSVSNSNLVTG